MEEIIFKKGITQKQIRQLIAYSNSDPQVMKNTNDSKRFANIESFDKWMKIPREIYTLTNKNDELLGIVWFREQDLKSESEYGITFAIRIYGKARGKGLSEDFLKKAFDEYKKLRNPSKKFWLETRADNLSAINLYEKFGFKKLRDSDAGERIIMIQS